MKPHIGLTHVGRQSPLAFALLPYERNVARRAFAGRNVSNQQPSYTSSSLHDRGRGYKTCQCTHRSRKSRMHPHIPRSGVRPIRTAPWPPSASFGDLAHVGLSCTFLESFSRRLLCADLLLWGPCMLVSRASCCSDPRYASVLAAAVARLRSGIVASCHRCRLPPTCGTAPVTRPAWCRISRAARAQKHEDRTTILLA